MRHRLFPWNMDADRAGNWAPFVVAILLLAIAGLGIWSAPAQQSVVEAESEYMIPQFIEHFPQNESDVVPNDGVLRIAWHPENSELGSLKTNDRYLELGEKAIVEQHVSKFWSPPAGLSNDGGLIVDIILSIDAKGNVLLAEVDEGFGSTSSKRRRIMVEEAIRTIYKASPLPLPLEKAELWVGKETIFKFDPSKFVQ